MLKNKCNVIHVHWAIPTGLIGVWVGSLLKKPFIVTVHGSDLRMAIERPGFLEKYLSTYAKMPLTSIVFQKCKKKRWNNWAS